MYGNEVRTSETVFQVEIKSPTEADSQHHASILPSGLQARKSATRRLVKLLVSNCQTSAEKLPDFSAEVAEVLLSVFLTHRKEVIFYCILSAKQKRNDFVFNKLKFLLEKFVCVDEFRNFGQTFV